MNTQQRPDDQLIASTSPPASAADRPSSTASAGSNPTPAEEGKPSGSNGAGRRSPRIVVIGGVAGGASAAARARRLSEDAHIILLERGPDVSFANCGLPYHIGGEITDRSRLAVQTPESLKKMLNLDVRVQTEAVSIDRENKSVSVKNLITGETSPLSYDYLVLAPGAAPIVPPLAGIDDRAVLTLRNLGDMDRIKSAAERADRVLIIGAGFIGLEMAEQLKQIGKKVHVIELQEQILPQVDPEIVEPVMAELRENGVELILGDGISGFKREGESIVALLNSGKTISADLVVLSIGVRPESQLAKAAGLEIGPRGHIVVNQFQQTSDSSIYAAGDACETEDPILGTRTAIPLGGPANRQGRTVADHIFQGDKALPYPGSIGTSIVRVFALAVGTTGYNEKRLKDSGVDFSSVTINAQQHAEYFPGARYLMLKILWDRKDGRLLGGAAVGPDGVDKRLDVLATAIRGRLTIDDLCHLELSYAPPFGSAKDPVNIAGFAACNIRDGLLVAGDGTEDGCQLIDVRPRELAELRPLPNSRNIPLTELRDRLGEIDRDQPVTTVCAYGKTSYFASRVLRLNGFDAKGMIGGLASHTEMRPKDVGSSQAAPPAEAKSTATTQPTAKAATTDPTALRKLDCTGLSCPGPIMRVKAASSELAPGEVLEITASDAGFLRDLPAFCEANRFEFLGAEKTGGVVVGSLRAPAEGACPLTTESSGRNNNDATLVVFSQEMDKVLASLVIANGAMAMGGKATLFFTFWGLNALRKDSAPPTNGKTIMDKMFGAMMPRGAERLPLSNMNFAGMGAKMMKGRMASKKLPNVNGLLQDAISGGARLVACAMSMDAMGIREEELIEGVEIGGVAEFLNASGKSGTNLFI